jgi:tetratricopeptide (TPR) repeat protein
LLNGLNIISERDTNKATVTSKIRTYSVTACPCSHLRLASKDMNLIFLMGVFITLHPLRAQNISQAEQDFAAGNYNKVQQLLGSHISKLDRRPLILLAKSYSKLKNHQAATKVYRAVVASNKNDLEAKTFLAVELLNMDQESEAKQTLREVLETNPRFVPAYNRLAEIYEKSSNNYELRLLYQDLISKIGEKEPYITKLCVLTTDDGLYDLSKNYCQKGIKINPKQPLNFLYLAQTFLQTEKQQQGMSLLKKVSQKFPSSFEVQFFYAQKLQDSKNFIESNKSFRTAAKLNPKSYQAWLGLAFTDLELQQYDQAVLAFKSACDADKAALSELRRGISLLRSSQALKPADKLDQISEKCGTSKGL